MKRLIISVMLCLLTLLVFCSCSAKRQLVSEHTSATSVKDSVVVRYDSVTVYDTVRVNLPVESDKEVIPLAPNSVATAQTSLAWAKAWVNNGYLFLNIWNKPSFALNLPTTTIRQQTESIHESAANESTVVKETIVKYRVPAWCYYILVLFAVQIAWGVYQLKRYVSSKFI